MTAPTLTPRQEFRDRVMDRIERDHLTACDAFLLELADGADIEEVVAFANELLPGSGADYR